MFQSKFLRKTLAAGGMAAALVLAYAAGWAQAAPRTNLVAQAASKLTVSEVNALTSAALAVADASTASCTADSDGPSLEDVLRHHRELMEELMKPAKFEGPMGEQYDSYADYLWGVYGVRIRGCEVF